MKSSAILRSGKCEEWGMCRGDRNAEENVRKCGATKKEMFKYAIATSH